MEHPHVTKTLGELVAEARSHKRKSSSCVDMPAAQPDGATVKGWSIMLSVYEHDDIEHWHFSAMLYPKGRSSTKDDWNMLGYITATLQDLTGYPRDAPNIEPLTPFETTHPNRVHHWVWHSDGSPIDPRLMVQIQKILG